MGSIETRGIRVMCLGRSNVRVRVNGVRMWSFMVGGIEGVRCGHEVDASSRTTCSPDISEHGV